MENLSDDKNDKINQILNYLQTTDNNFEDYVNFLLSIKNTNLNIINGEVFNTFKTLKKIKALSKQSIIDEIKLN